MQAGRVYKIVGGDINNQKVYVGSTTKTLDERFKKHKYNYKDWQKTHKKGVTLYKIFDEFGTDKCKIHLIQEMQFDNLSQLREAENQAIRNTPNAINIRIEATTPEQKLQKAKEALEKNKDYHRRTGYAAQKKYHSSENGKAKLSEAVKRYRAKRKAAAEAQPKAEKTKQLSTDANTSEPQHTNKKVIEM